mgnify:CR=1 FL=1
MTPDDYKDRYGEKTLGRFKLMAPNGEFILQVPLWIEKYFLKDTKSKKFRIQKKVVKKQVIQAIKRGME